MKDGIQARAWRILLLALAIGVLTACGFHPRGAARLPAAMAVTSIEGLAAYDPLRQRIRWRLEAAGVRVVEDPEAATARLQILARNFLKRPLTVSQRGQVTEYELVRSLRFRVIDADDRTLVPEQTLTITRSYLFDRTNPLGTSSEEAAIAEAMERDLVSLLLRRLEAVSGKAAR
ncbi:MAG TPA: hypothetical protein ENJ83_02145 [Rhodospirillales bacterium]|nr:hypothetical protein [Rhodospirillales bacterium]